MNIYVNFWHFLRCPLSKYGHVTWLKKQISKKLLFPNSAFNIWKSYKVFSRKALYFRSYQPETSRGVENTFRVKLLLFHSVPVEFKRCFDELVVSLNRIFDENFMDVLNYDIIDLVSVRVTSCGSIMG